jgi:hypothetical protein
MFEQISKNLTQKSYLFQKFLPTCQLDQSQIGKIPTQKRFKKKHCFSALHILLVVCNTVEGQINGALSAE